MKDDAKADLARFVDRWTVEYVRMYPHPIERIWRATSDPKEISVWFWTATFDLRVGGSFAFGPERVNLRRVRSDRSAAFRSLQRAFACAESQRLLSVHARSGSRRNADDVRSALHAGLRSASRTVCGPSGHPRRSVNLACRHVDGLALRVRRRWDNACPARRWETRRSRKAACCRCIANTCWRISHETLSSEAMLPLTNLLWRDRQRSDGRIT